MTQMPVATQIFADSKNRFTLYLTVACVFTYNGIKKDIQLLFKICENQRCGASAVSARSAVAVLFILLTTKIFIDCLHP